MIQTIQHPEAHREESSGLATIDQVIILELRIQDEIDQLRKEIAAARFEIEAISPDKSIGQLSRLGTIQLYELALETWRRRETRLGLLEAALERIDDGDYGECESCHQSIPWARLDAQPEARRCHRCA